MDPDPQTPEGKSLQSVPKDQHFCGKPDLQFRSPRFTLTARLSSRRRFPCRRKHNSMPLPFSGLAGISLA